VCAVFTQALSEVVLLHIPGSQYITYSDGMDRIDDKTRFIVQELLKHQYSQSDAPQLTRELNDISERGDIQIQVVDFQGNVIAKSDNATQAKVSLAALVEGASLRRAQDQKPGEYDSVYPVSVMNESAFVVGKGFPPPNRMEKKWTKSISILLAVIAFIWLFFIITRTKINYIENLVTGLGEIAKGNLGYRFKEHGKDELASLATHINHMSSELKTRIEEERHVEQTKNELITNVSHDLRTPLTLISGYLNLLRDGNYQTEDQMKQYIQIAYAKSEKLKTLIDDLFEFTKISNQGYQLHYETVNLVGLMEQLVEEHMSIIEQQGLTLMKVLPMHPVLVEVDPIQITRVFENVLTNAIKYSHKPSEIVVSMSVDEENATVSVENQADTIPAEDLANLFERFYRVDKSRSSKTGGSGLGLAIAKGIMERHGGHIWAESVDQTVKFCTSLPRKL
jgi:signal transduction histidine kinase